MRITLIMMIKHAKKVTYENLQFYRNSNRFSDRSKSCLAPGAISLTLGARALVEDHIVSTSSPHVLPAPLV